MRVRARVRVRAGVRAMVRARVRTRLPNPRTVDLYATKQRKVSNDITGKNHIDINVNKRRLGIESERIPGYPIQHPLPGYPGGTQYSFGFFRIAKSAKVRCSYIVCAQGLKVGSNTISSPPVLPFPSPAAKRPPP